MQFISLNLELFLFSKFYNRTVICSDSLSQAGVGRRILLTAKRLSLGLTVLFSGSASVSLYGNLAAIAKVRGATFRQHCVRTRCLLHSNFST